MDVLDDQIAAYEAMLPSLQQKHGDVWVIVAAEKLAGTFEKFADAAQYVKQHLGAQQVLIRHTHEAALTAPFVHIEG